MKKFNTIVLSCLFSFNLFAADGDVTLANEYKKLEVKEPAHFVTKRGGSPEAICYNPDGTKFGYIASWFESTKTYPNDLFFGDPETGDMNRLTKRGRFLNIATHVSFTHDNNIVSSELEYRPLSIVKTLYHVAKGEEMFPYGYHSSIKIYSPTGKKLREIQGKDVGFKTEKEFLQHPRISPNGEWLTFYIKGVHEPAGVYLTNLKTLKTIRLSTDLADKHPTWTSTGDRILFHTQKGGLKKGVTEPTPDDEETEEAYLGYFELKFENGEAKVAKRVMIDDINKPGYIFHKHPTLYPGTDLLFFHGQLGPDKAKKLFVRKLKPGSKIYKLEILDENGEEMHKLKHPATSFTDSGLLFIGKKKGDKDFSIFHLDHQFIKELKLKD